MSALISDKAPEPVGSYPHARRHGDLIYLSGVGPRTRGCKDIPGVTLDSAGKVTAYDIEIQTRAVIENVRLILAEAGCTLADALDIQVFLTNMDADFKIYNRVYSEYFNAITGPTRTTLGITALPTPIAVEFKVIAQCTKRL